MNVLALDPGERVGWARANVAEDGTWTEMRHGIAPLRDMALAIDRALRYQIVPSAWADPSPLGDESPYDVVVCESWRLYPHMAQHFVGSSFPSVQFIGMVRLICWCSSVKFVSQGANIKSTADKTMRKLRPDLYEQVMRPAAHDDAHDMDAIRHLWHYTWRYFVGISKEATAHAFD